MEKSYPFTLLPRYPGAREYPYCIIFNVGNVDTIYKYFTFMLGPGGNCGEPMSHHLVAHVTENL